MSKTQVGTPTRLGDLTIIPLERINCDHFQHHSKFYTSGSKEPLAVLFERQGSLWVVDLDGRLLDLENLLEEVPGLSQLVEGLRRS